jgi:hypothetical protein
MRKRGTSPCHSVAFLSHGGGELLRPGISSRVLCSSRVLRGESNKLRLHAAGVVAFFRHLSQEHRGRQAYLQHFEQCSCSW